MNKKIMVRLTGLIAFIVLFAVFDTKAQEVTPPAGQSVVYVICEKSKGYKLNISCDGNLIGRFKKKQYKYHFVRPGEHYFTGELTGYVSLANNAQIKLDCEENKSYYIVARAGGVTIYDISIEFAIVDEMVGKSMVKKFKQL